MTVEAYEPPWKTKRWMKKQRRSQTRRYSHPQNLFIVLMPRTLLECEVCEDQLSCMAVKDYRLLARLRSWDEAKGIVE
jgi:hypothetical protein